GLAAPTMLAHGSDDLKARLLRPLVTGEHTWCQLFSEPGSGSDLAGLTTRAEPDGDEWVVNGQKVWNTSAHHADYGLLLARTDWDVPKHRGITYLACPPRRRPRRPPAHRRPALDAAGRALDRAAGACRPAAGPHARPRGVARQARRQSHRARRGRGARPDHRPGGDARRRRRAAGRPDHR